MKSTNGVSRRDFTKAVAVGAGGLTILGTKPARAAATRQVFRVGLIGCGGRGNGALQQHVNAAKILNKALGWNPNYHRTDVDGVAVGADGHLYVLSGGPNVRVFDRQGNYLRTIMPPAANVPAEQMTLIDWTKTRSDSRFHSSVAALMSLPVSSTLVIRG